MSKGILTKEKYDTWTVKWSDMHSFIHGTHWEYTQLTEDSNSIRYLEDGEVKHKPLEEGLLVDFEFAEVGYDPETFMPSNSKARLVFPEVEKFEKEQYYKEYLTKGGLLFTISKISALLDGGTIVLYDMFSKRIPFYIHKDNWTLHSGRPTTDDNIVTDKATQMYVVRELERYREDCEDSLKRVNNIINNIKL